MDKKLYLEPESKVFTVEIQNSILAGSIPGLEDDNTLNGGDDKGQGGENFDPSLY